MNFHWIIDKIIYKCYAYIEMKCVLILFIVEIVVKIKIMIDITVNVNLICMGLVAVWSLGNNPTIYFHNTYFNSFSL